MNRGRIVRETTRPHEPEPSVERIEPDGKFTQAFRTMVRPTP